jgi:lipid-binding SYLF domain-containing protein
MNRADSRQGGRTNSLTLFCAVIFLVITAIAAHAEIEKLERSNWENEARKTREMFESKRPELRAFFEKSHAYAIYPKIRKFAYAVGYASGHGMVFQGEKAVGFSQLTQVTYGLTLGIHSFAEVIFFRNPEIFEKFKSGKLDLDAEASVVAGKAAAMTSYDFDSDILVYTITNTGLFFDLSLGGQKFSFEQR